MGRTDYMVHTESIIRKAVSAIRAMSWRERLMLAQATALLPLARLAGDTIARYSAAGHASAGATDARAQRLARRTAYVVALAAAGLPFHCTCLQRSAVLHLLLREQGVDANLRIGVRRKEGEFQAHAWVEMAGQPINDAEDIASAFAPFE